MNYSDFRKNIWQAFRLDLYQYVYKIESNSGGYHVDLDFDIAWISRGHVLKNPHDIFPESDWFKLIISRDSDSSSAERHEHRIVSTGENSWMAIGKEKLPLSSH